MKTTLLYLIIASVFIGTPSVADDYDRELRKNLIAELDRIMEEGEEGLNITEEQANLLETVFNKLNHFGISRMLPRNDQRYHTRDIELEAAELQSVPVFSSYYLTYAAEPGFPGYLTRANMLEISSYFAVYKPYEFHSSITDSLWNGPRTVSHIISLMSEDDQFNYEAFLTITQRVVEKMQEDGELGDVFEVYFSRNTRLFKLSPRQFKKLTERFEDDSCKTPPLNTDEQRLKDWGVVNEDEIHELRAIRFAGAVIEESTPMREDFGGVSGSFAHLGYNQASCGAESRTQGMLVDKLERLGFVKHFEFVGTGGRWLKDLVITATAHVCGLIRNKRNKELFAIESYYEDGGEFPYILPANDWLRGGKKNLIADCRD